LTSDNWKSNVTSVNESNHIFCLNNSSVSSIKTALSITVADGNIDRLENCAIAHLRLGIDKTAFKNTYYNNEAINSTSG
jgi:hypothetical protein